MRKGLVPNWQYKIFKDKRRLKLQVEKDNK